MKKGINLICLIIIIPLTLSLFPVKSHAESSMHKKIIVEESEFDENAHGEITVDAIAGEPKYRVYEDGTLYIYGEGIWDNKYRYDDVNFIYMENEVSEIGEGAFSFYQNLNNVRLPENITQINDTTFFCCNFSYIKIPDTVESIGTQAFYKCENLTSVVLPKKLKEIKNGAFLECRNLEKIEIPSNVISIGESVFNGCDNLIIFCNSGTVAEQYAKDNNIKFELLNHTHKYQSTITKEPTCTETGIITYACSCGDEYTEEIPATGHNEVIDPAIEPTETEDGKTEGSHCGVCGEISKKQETVSLTGKPTEKPEDTIYKEGDIIYKDKNVIIAFDGISGEENEYYINFIIENISSRTIEVQVRETSINGFMVNPTCSMEISPGKKIKDGMTIDLDDAKTTPMSSVQNIETRFHIFDWNDDEFGYDTNSIRMKKAHVHSYNSTEIVQKATCTENGIIKYICFCGSFYTKSTPMEEHNYSSWEIVKEANCRENGRKRRECYNCYTYEYETIPRNSKLHDWSYWHNTIFPTALKSGKSERECYVCHTVEVKKAKKLKAKITISTKKKNLKIGKSFYLSLKRYTYGDEISKFTSSNKKVATVNKKGKVVAKKKGKAKITVKMKSGCQATCNVIVK